MRAIGTFAVGTALGLFVVTACIIGGPILSPCRFSNQKGFVLCIMCGQVGTVARKE